MDERMRGVCVCVCVRCERERPNALRACIPSIVLPPFSVSSPASSPFSFFFFFFSFTYLIARGIRKNQPVMNTIDDLYNWKTTGCTSAASTFFVLMKDG